MNRARGAPAMQTRRIILDRLEVQASIGILEHERQAPQRLVIDAEFEVDATHPVIDGDLSTVLDYRLLRDALVDEATQHHTDLLESLAQRSLRRILEDFPQVQRVRLRLCKPQALADCAAVCIEQCAQRV